jgi:hypothetical protein
MNQPSPGKLLIDSSTLIVLPTLATLIGLNEAIVLQQIHYWTNKYENDEEKKWKNASTFTTVGSGFITAKRAGRKNIRFIFLKKWIVNSHTCPNPH